MKRTAIPFLILLLCLCADAPAQPSYSLKSWVKTRRTDLKVYDKPNMSGWTLVFEDNFDGKQIDTSLWHTCTGGWKRNHANKPLYYKDENVILQNGIVRLTARRDPGVHKGWFADVNEGKGGWRDHLFDYSSAIIETKEKYCYGFFEARCKIPSGPGFWPGFWMFGGGGEIDVFEFNSSKPKKHYITVHDWPDNAPHRQFASSWRSRESFADDFHTFSVEWDKWKLVFRVDGIARRADFRYITPDGKVVENASQYDPATAIENPLFPTGEQCVKLNLSIPADNSTFMAPPDERTPFPSSMDVDFFRIYRIYTIK